MGLRLENELPSSLPILRPMAGVCIIVIVFIVLSCISWLIDAIIVHPVEKVLLSRV